MHRIENYVPITQAKSKLMDLVRSLHDTDDTIAITKNGVPEAVLISMDKFEGEAICWKADESGYFTISEELGGTPARVYFYPRIYPGDIDGIDAVDLKDAILGLKVVAIIEDATPMIRSGYPESGADVNGDKRIGIEEVSFILQDITGLRE